MRETRLTTVPNGFEAEMICGRLRLEGIECNYRLTDIGGAWTGCVPSASGPTEVIVGAADLERARELLGLG